MKSKGLGDSVEKFTKATGIKKVVDTVSRQQGSLVDVVKDVIV